LPKAIGEGQDFRADLRCCSTGFSTPQEGAANFFSPRSFPKVPAGIIIHSLSPLTRMVPSLFFQHFPSALNQTHQFNSFSGLAGKTPRRRGISTRRALQFLP
jgi:hypothetical protein